MLCEKYICFENYIIIEFDTSKSFQKYHDSRNKRA